MTEMRRETREIVSPAEWLDWRRLDITASRVAALFDSHPFLDRDGLAAELRGQSRGDNAAMRRGRILEPAVAAAMAEERPDLPLRKATTYHRLPDHRIGATPDYFADTAAGVVNVQCKTVHPDTWEKWKSHPPLGYRIQVACENLVTDAVAGMLAVMVISPSYPVHIFDVPRHPGAEARILDAVAEWWRAWDAGEIAAPADPAELAAACDDGSHRDLSGDPALPALLAERADLKATVGAAEKRLGILDYEIKNRIGPARTAYLPGWSLSFATQRRKETLIPAKDIRVLRVRAINEAEDVE
jgi:hypothetical protein